MAIIPMPWVSRILIWFLLVVSFIRAHQTHARRRTALAVAAIEIDSENYVAVRYVGNDLWFPATITSRFIHPWLTAMSLRVEGRRWPVSVVIAADAVEPEPFRRWRAALKLQTEAT